MEIFEVIPIWGQILIVLIVAIVILNIALMGYDPEDDDGPQMG